MNILIITQIYAQPDDVGDNKPTKTVNYFAKEWVVSSNNVYVIHCSSKFPFLLYMMPVNLRERISGKTSKIFPTFKSRKILRYKELGIDVCRLPMFKSFPGRQFSNRTINLQEKKITKLLSETGFVPDLIVGHFANPSTRIVSDLAKQYNAMSSIVFHHDCNANTVGKYRLRELVAGIGAIGTRSMTEAYDVEKLLNLNRAPFVCYSGVPNEIVKNNSRFCEKHGFKDGVNYIYVGSMISRKHLDTVIRAFCALHNKNDNAELIIVGGGPEEKKMKALATKLDCYGKVAFTGRLPREEVFDKMKKANIFTLISDNEVFGMVYFEAMLQGCITIASKGEGFDGIIVDGENGFICEAGNLQMLESIYRRIENMSTNERNRVGQNAINTAVHFSESEVAKNYLDNIILHNKKVN